MKTKDIDKIMKILSKKYLSYEKTTLNRMRKNPDAFRILITCLLSLKKNDLIKVIKYGLTFKGIESYILVSKKDGFIDQSIMFSYRNLMRQKIKLQFFNHIILFQIIPQFSVILPSPNTADYY